MIIAVDFDGTLQLSDGTANFRLIQSLKANQRGGDTIILWTCREGNSLKSALAFLKQYGFAPNFVNQNSPAVIKRLGYDSRKIHADVYIDDKSIN